MVDMDNIIVLHTLSAQHHAPVFTPTHAARSVLVTCSVDEPF